MARQEEAADLLNGYGGFHIGRLKVGAVGPYHVTEMLTTFNERYPQITLSVRIGNSREVLDRLIDYSADVAVLAHIEDDPQFWTKPYSRHPVVVFVNMDHPWTKRRSISIEKLEGQRMVLREVGVSEALPGPLRISCEDLDRRVLFIGDYVGVGPVNGHVDAATWHRLNDRRICFGV